MAVLTTWIGVWLVACALLAVGACLKALLSRIERALVFKVPPIKMNKAFEESALVLATRRIQARTADRPGLNKNQGTIWKLSTHKLRYFVCAEPEHDGILVFYHGNACLASDMTMFVTKARRFNMACALVEYPGYAEPPALPRQDQSLVFSDAFGFGRRPGTLPCQTEVLQNALLTFDFIMQEHSDLASKRVVVAGESLGSCVATYVASRRQRKVKTLVLVSCFPSIAHVAKIPALGPLMQNNFNAARWAPKVTAQTFMIHGTCDAIAPPDMCLLQASNFVVPVRINWITNADHNNLTRTRMFWQHFYSVVCLNNAGYAGDDDNEYDENVSDGHVV